MSIAIQQASCKHLASPSVEIFSKGLRFSDSWLQGYQELYHGNCPETMSGKECLDAGLDTGSMHRTDSFRETNVVRQLREAEARCKLLGLTGRDLAICAAPRNGEWTIDTGL